MTFLPRLSSAASLSRSAVDGRTVREGGSTQARRGADVVTAGGRVLTVVGRGENYRSAIAHAYDGAGKISFDGMQYRHDIGRKALAKTS